MKGLKICLISKYPPHRGGTASGIYWYARTLGSLGAKIHVVTDIPKEGYKIENKIGYEPENVRVHTVKREESLESTVFSLMDKIVEVVKKFDIDILDSKYLTPYCVAAKMAKDETGLPLVVRHGGSDLRILERNRDDALINVLRGADLVSTSRMREPFFTKMGVERKRLTFESGFGINHEFFGPHVKPFDIPAFGDYKGPVVGIFGKMAYKKGLEETLKALSAIDFDYTLLLVPENREIVEKRVEECDVQEKTLIMDYQPPWLMPSLYSVSDMVISMDVNIPMKTHIPLVAIEALNAGVCVVTNKETHEKPFFRQFTDNKSIVIADIKKTESYRRKLTALMRNKEKTKSIGLAARSICKKHEGKMLAENMLRTYEKLL